MDTHHPPRTPASPGRDFRKSYLSSLGFNKDKIEALLEAKIVGKWNQSNINFFFMTSCDRFGTTETTCINA